MLISSIIKIFSDFSSLCKSLYKFVSLKIKTYTLKHIIYLISISLFLLIMGCAKQGSPQGGPKDEDPPAVLECIPENYSTHFSENKIKIEFDEFVQLQNITQQLLVSPPLKNQPIVKLKGKSIEIEFEDTLKRNTTYTFNFGNAIVDNHEGNPIVNYEYVFSTGNYIDSMAVRGKLANSFNLKPPTDPFYVMLYENLSDSAPILEFPSYIHRTNKEGFYSINNVKNDTFRVFALKDANNNMLFDLPNESIGFYDTTLILSSKIYNELNPAFDSVMIIIDTIANMDSIIVQYKNDTSHYDTIKLEAHKTYAFHLNLYSFDEEIKIQYLSSATRPKKEKLLMTFNMPLHEPANVELLNDSIQVEDWYIQEDDFALDTLEFWITDTIISNLELINLVVTYYQYDSTKQLILTNDTVPFRYVEKQQRRKKEVDSENIVKKSPLVVTSNPGSNQTIELNKVIAFFASIPIDTLDYSKISFCEMIDSIEVPQNFSFVRDSILYLTKSYFSFPWKENTTYKLTLFPGAFNDIYGNTNDTTSFVYLSRALDYYGNIILHLTGITQPLIVQLIDNNENVLEEKYTRQNGTIKFDYLLPKKYSFKFIVDKNNNRKWDTGNYLKKIEPETVGYLPDEINVRSNWDVEVEWDIEKMNH